MSRDNNIQAVRRLTPIQEGILFHTLEAKRSGVYFEQYSCLYEGRVDTDRLRRAWFRVVERHEVLHTLFTWEGRDKPLQIVRHTVPLPWEELDWRDADEHEAAERWQDFLDRDRARGFELDKAPLIRLTLVRVADDRYRFLWSFHHLLIDGWSMRLILNEVTALYAGGDGSSPLPRPRSFGDLIAWMEGQDTAKQEAFWTDALSGFTEPTSLSAIVGSQQLPVSGHPHDTQETVLDASLTAQVRAFARAERLTLNTVLLGAWSLVLGRYCDRADVVFGTTVSGRPAELDGVDGIAGMFINTLPLRVDIPENETPGAWLSRLQARQMAMRAHEQTSLAAVQRWSDVPAGSALFESIFVFENFPEKAAGGALVPELYPRDERYIEYSNYPLAILAVPGEQIRLIAVHDPAIFTAETAKRLLENLATAVASLTAAATETVSAVTIVPAAERTRLLEQWNRTAAPYPSDRCIHHQIEHFARTTPDAVALADTGTAVSYDELDSRANRLAVLLQSRGIGVGAIVPVFLDRGIDAIVAMLAVLKAGGAYVPLDPTFPKDRIRHILEDIAAADTGRTGQLIVLSNVALSHNLPTSVVEPVCLDDGDLPSDTGPFVEPGVTPDDLAYVIYTSGSTGRPKGVMVTHRNLVNSTHARHAFFGEPLSSFLLLSSLATDSSVAGTYWALCSGASLVLPPRRIEQDIPALTDLVARRQVSHYLCVPSLHALILEHSSADRLASLKGVMVAGEACTEDVVLNHYTALPDVTLYNEYGPTEATVWATGCTLKPGEPVSIGRPIANTTAYVLDSHQRLLPAGVPGELCIGGVNVARGYLNQPELTAERFITDRYADDHGARLYRTDDLVRHREDGTIVFLGRVDNQVKIRGFRVEPEEIERVILECGAVSEAAVIATGTGSDGADPTALLSQLQAMPSDEAERLLTEIETLEMEAAAI